MRHWLPRFALDLWNNSSQILWEHRWLLRSFSCTVTESTSSLYRTLCIIPTKEQTSSTYQASRAAQEKWLYVSNHQLMNAFTTSGFSQSMWFNEGAKCSIENDRWMGTKTAKHYWSHIFCNNTDLHSPQSSADNPFQLYKWCWVGSPKIFQLTICW